jgi:hypothetical protein
MLCSLVPTHGPSLLPLPENIHQVTNQSSFPNMFLTSVACRPVHDPFPCIWLALLHCSVVLPDLSGRCGDWSESCDMRRQPNAWMLPQP